MKENELRIGNYIYTTRLNLDHDVFTDNDKDYRVVSVSAIDNSVLRDSSGYWYDIEYFKPIPLTEEWLLKFGFVKMDEKHNFFIHGYQINFKVDKKMKWVAWCNTVLTNVEIKYVHQLQNLYFALTNEELTIKDL